MTADTLPPLPPKRTFDCIKDECEAYDDDDMRTYAQQAVEAERERLCAAIKAADAALIQASERALEAEDCIDIIQGAYTT